MSFSKALLAEMGQNEEFQIHAPNPDEHGRKQDILLSWGHCIQTLLYTLASQKSWETNKRILFKVAQEK